MRRLKRAVIGAAVMLLTLPLCSLGEVSAAGGVKLLNLALNKPATESSVYPGSGKDATKAVDGIVSADSRWSTKRLGTGTPAEQWDENVEQWMTVDLGQEYGITQVNINWEAACATKYTLQGSLDGQEFFDVVDGGASQAGEQQLTDFEKFTARYIRVLCREAKTAKYGYSIYELEVYSEDVIDDSYQPTAADVITEVENEAPVLAEDGKSLILPEVPEGYAIELYGTDNAQVVSKDNKVCQPLVDMPVNVMYKVTNLQDAEDTAESAVDALLTVPGKYTAQASDNEKPNVVPGLREWKGQEGSFRLTENSRIVYGEESQREAAEMLRSYLEDMLGIEAAIVQGEPQTGDIALENAYTQEELGPEGYYLEIGDVVKISAPTKQGLIYGGASITQILSQSDDLSAPRGLARDYPQYEVRAGMIDVGRMYIPLEYLKEITIYMSYYKMNEAHIHINDYWGQSGYSAFRLESEVYPSIVAKDGYYTKDAYRQYQKDMKAYGIDVITEIDTPYHAEAFRDIPGVVMWPGQAGRLDIRTEEAFNANAKILENLLDEYLDGEDPVIQSKYFHIGTDEYDKSAGEQMRKWTDHFAKYVNAKGYQSRAWASLGKNGFNGTTPVTNEIVMNLWAPYWADVHETYEAGYDVINTYGGWLYIVPAGNAGYPDRYDMKRLYEQFEVNNFKSGRNPSGEAIMPVAHPQTKGAEFALWNDMTSFRTGFSWFDIFDRVKDAVSLVSEKTWYGEDHNGQTYAEFRSRVDAVQDKAPNTNPGRVVKSATEQIAGYTFEEDGTAVKDGSANGYDGVLVNARAADGAVAFDGTGYLSMPVASIGYPYTVLMNLTLDEVREGATLFQGAEGSFYIDGEGKFAYSRDQYSFTFNYQPEAGKDMALALACDNKDLTLFVNGRKIGTGKLTNTTIAGKAQQSSTFVLPTEKIFENTKGTLKDLVVYNRVLSSEEIFDLLGFRRENLALNKSVQVSALEVSDGRFTGEMAVDGVVSKESRVSFAKTSDEQWLCVDLGESYVISEVAVNFESSVGKYEIQISEDGENFENVYTKNEATVQGATPALETIVLEPVEARYVKYVQKERWKHTGNGQWYSGSIYEFEVYAPLEYVPAPSKDALVAVEPNSQGANSASRQIGTSALNKVTVEFDMYTSLDPAQTNTAVGLGSADSAYTSYGQVPVIIRMYSDGCFGAYDKKAGGYVQSRVPYTQNEKYHVRIVVDMSKKTYDVYVTGPDKQEAVVAKGFGFRAAAPENIGKIYLFNNQQPAGSYWLEKIALTEKQVEDKSALEKLAAAAEALDEADYTPRSWAVLQEALESAKAVIANDDASREEIDRAVEELNGACDALEGRAQTTQLEMAIQEAKDILALGANYQETEALRAAVEEAERILADKNASQEAVDQAALHVLEELSRMAKTADILSLESMMAAAKELLAGAYTEDSLEALREAIQRAEEVIVDQNRADGDIAEAYEGLVDAVMQLEKKGNKAALAAVIARAEIVLAEQGRYAEATLRGLEEALASAKAVHEQEDALQSAIDDEVRSLTSKLAEARLKGDVNGDGTVTTSDCAALLAASAELTALGNTEAAAADVNGDGTADTTDAALILQYAGERISAF